MMTRINSRFTAAASCILLFAACFFASCAKDDGNYDYLRAAFVPVNVTLTPGVEAMTYTNTPSSFIGLDGPDMKLNLSSSWQTQAAVASIANANNYRLVFMWRNDGSMGSNPPAAIDSIVIARMPCGMPSNTAFVATTDSITFTWQSSASEF